MLRPKQIYSLERIVERTKDFIFVVEGKRDKKALSGLGIKKMLSISGQSLENVAEKLEDSKNVVILTDFDRDGKRKAEELERLLRSSHVKIERRVRKFFKKSLKITKIEELKEVAKLINSTNHYGKELNRKRFLKRKKWKSR